MRFGFRGIGDIARRADCKTLRPRRRRAIPRLSRHLSCIRHADRKPREATDGENRPRWHATRSYGCGASRSRRGAGGDWTHDVCLGALATLAQTQCGCGHLRSHWRLDAGLLRSLETPQESVVGGALLAAFLSDALAGFF